MDVAHLAAERVTLAPGNLLTGKRRMTDKDFEPWKQFIINASRTSTYENIARQLQSKGIVVKPKIIGHHLRRWGHSKNKAFKATKPTRMPNNPSISRRQLGKQPVQDEHKTSHNSLKEMCNRFTIDKPSQSTMILPPSGPSTAQHHGPNDWTAQTDTMIHDVGPYGISLDIDGATPLEREECREYDSLVEDFLMADADICCNDSPASLLSDVGPATPSDLEVHTPSADSGHTLNFLGFTELQYDSLVLPYAYEHIPRQLNTPSEEQHEHEFLVGLLAWFDNFWDIDPQGKTLNKFSRLELTMKNLVVCVEQAISINNIGFWLSLQGLPQRLDLDTIYPNTYTTMASYLVHLMHLQPEHTQVTRLCLMQLATCAADRLGAAHPITSLLNLALRRQLTLQFCSRLWGITRCQRVPGTGRKQIDWRVRQGHGFGAVLYNFGRVHEGQDLLRLALSDARKGGNCVDQVSIKTDLHFMTAEVGQTRSLTGDTSFLWDTIGIAQRMADLRISVDNLS